ncbi:MAG: hypothetical protein ABW096_14335 [Candidatus Thiodiazotropha sp.]
MNSRSHKYILVIAILFQTELATGDESTIHQQKLDTIVKLLSESSVSENILNSNSDVAIQYYNLSKTAYRHAVSEFNNGDIEKSNLFIKKATDALTNATMFANMNKGNVNLEPDRHKYEDTKKSVDALLKAVHRVADEKGTSEENREMLDRVNKLNKQAVNYATNNQYRKATQNLEQILSLIRNNIINLKMGDTLVRTLTFANPKEEFRYEIDRNDAHFLLLKSFLPASVIDNESNTSFSKDKSTAYKLRKKAENHAKKKDYNQAINTLERSTEILINIIRMAGTEIPG